MEENRKYLYLGFFFLFIQAVSIFRNVVFNYYGFFWFCDFVSLPLAIGFFLRKENFIKAIINIGLIPQVGFILLYFYKLIFGISLVDVIPNSSSLLYVVLTLFMHLSITFAFIFTYKNKPKISTLFSSLMFLFGMYILALFFTTEEQGINYVLSSKVLIPLVIPHYTELWVILAFLVIVLPTHLIQYLIYGRYSNKSN